MTGWEVSVVRLQMPGGKVSVRECLVKGPLCVFRINPKFGWGIASVELGMRISCGGRVAVSEEVCMRVVERILPLLQDWKAYFNPPWKPNEKWLGAFEGAWALEEPYGYLPLVVK